MKSLKISIGIFFALLLMNIYMFNYMKNTVGSIEEKTEAAKISAAEEDRDKTLSILNEIKDEVDQYQNVWHVMSNHGEVDKVQNSITMCIGYAEKNSFHDVLANLYALEYNVTNLIDREHVNISNIF